MIREKRIEGESQVRLDLISLAEDRSICVVASFYVPEKFTFKGATFRCLDFHFDSPESDTACKFTRSGRCEMSQVHEMDDQLLELLKRGGVDAVFLHMDTLLTTFEEDF